MNLEIVDPTSPLLDKISLARGAILPANGSQRENYLRAWKDELKTALDNHMAKSEYAEAEALLRQLEIFCSQYHLQGSAAEQHNRDLLLIDLLKKQHKPTDAKSPTN
jgi:hypothetical protein